MTDEIRDRQWHLRYLKIREAHQVSTGNGVVVAVIDTGVSRHVDLSGSILQGIDFLDKGGSGSKDENGHGTAIAGLIAAHGKDGRSALGIAPGAKILPVRALKNGHADLNVGPAIEYAVRHGATVINISLGGGLTPATLDAVENAAEADVVIVAAAGNKPEDSAVIAPAFLEGVVAVSAIDRVGRIAAVSVTGPEIDIAAPGQDIESTHKNGGYLKNGLGTSNAAAIVSGAAALLRSKYPEMSARQVVERLESTATDRGPPGVDDEYGHGIVNIVAALSAGPPSASTSASGPPSPTATAAPTPGQRSSTTTLAYGGLTLAVLLGGLLALLLIRRHRR